MDEDRVFAAELQAHLPDGFQKRQRLDVTHSAANLDDDDVHVGGHLAQGSFDFVGDVRDDLDGLAQVVAAALFADDGFVDTARGPVMVAGESGVGEAFVVAEVEVSLGAIVGDEDLAVLERRQGAGVNVKVRVEFLEGDFEPATL